MSLNSDPSRSSNLVVQDEAAMLSLGAKIANALTSGGVIYLHGELGAGKTTLTRGILQEMGATGNIKSPTYTLVEPYQLEDRMAYHFDLYRLADAEELEFMGIRDYDSRNQVAGNVKGDVKSNVIIIEWPERGEGFLPQADLHINIEYQGQQRCLQFSSGTERGKIIATVIESASEA